MCKCVENNKDLIYMKIIQIVPSQIVPSQNGSSQNGSLQIIPIQNASLKNASLQNASSQNASLQIIPSQISLGNRDQYLLQIEAQIQDKRKWLLNKRKVLKKTVKENKFLEGVKSDYEKYHNFIVNQKQQQIKAMSLLNQYIGDIIVSGKLTEKDIQQTKNEEKEILGQIDKIKNDLDEIMKE